MLLIRYAQISMLLVLFSFMGVIAQDNVTLREFKDLKGKSWADIMEEEEAVQQVQVPKFRSWADVTKVGLSAAAKPFIPSDNVQQEESKKPSKYKAFQCPRAAKKRRAKEVLEAIGHENLCDLIWQCVNKRISEATLLSKLKAINAGFATCEDRSLYANITCDQERSALHIAASYLSSTIVEFLLVDMCADISMQDIYMKTALHYAIQNKRYENVEVLLKGDNGALINSQEKWGKTPAHYAAFNKDDKIMGLLRFWGADFSIKDRKGRTADSLN